MTDEKIQRINELYRKSKAEGLTEEELQEQKNLYAGPPHSGSSYLCKLLKTSKEVSNSLHRLHALVLSRFFLLSHLI